ncbi:MAG: hypothetical protein KBA28_02730 [Syntrophaceae bacterium]|jgi:hypothetical protein|nr:hypothetical protein [Syntrophaceae bacterium]
MKKIVLNTVLLMIIVVIPVLVSAQMDVQVRINIPLPPPIVFPAPPAVVVIPETDIYAIPDVHDDIFFYDGWWWRPWEGRWYRSRHYDRGWAYYNRMPSFQRHVPHNWRQDYRDRRWKGHSWDSRAISYRDAEKNWRTWKQNKHWKNENYWGVRGMDRMPPGQQKKYQRGPDNFPKGEGHGHGKGHGQGQGKKDQRD